MNAKSAALDANIDRKARIGGRGWCGLVCRFGTSAGPRNNSTCLFGNNGKYKTWGINTGEYLVPSPSPLPAKQTPLSFTPTRSNQPFISMSIPFETLRRDVTPSSNTIFWNSSAAFADSQANVSFTYQVDVKSHTFSSTELAGLAVSRSLLSPSPS
jgi:hypothetical protein